MRVLYMSGDTEEDIANTSVIGEQAAVLQEPFAPDALAVKVSNVRATIRFGCNINGEINWLILCPQKIWRWYRPQGKT